MSLQDKLRRFRFRDFGLSIVWLLVTLGTAVSLAIAKVDPHFLDDFGTFVKLIILALTSIIYGQLVLFYYDAYADVREGIPRHDVTIERFMIVLGLVSLTFAVSAGLIDNLSTSPTWRIPIVIFSYLVIIYGLAKRAAHANQSLFPEKDEHHATSQD